MIRSLLLASVALLAPAPLIAQTAAPAPASLDALTRQVNIPYERFTLDNGLTVIVVTDRKAPVVGISVWYDVGSKHEPAGKTGFAHLFEHLMFGGSENVPNFDLPLTEAGSTQTNGSTSFDRTNYVETVPVGALDRALFMESDRMGWLLGAVTQAKLDAQRGVVQNEKRQRDNQPYGLVDYATSEALYPAGHPYGHSPIGSMADLDAASLEDVKGWFRQHYGPNNVILALAGDIDAATARPLVEKYFGAIPRGPDAATVKAEVPTLPARKELTLKDRIATTRLGREWIVPGLNHPDSVPLSIGLAVLGGLSSSRLDNALVRQEKTAVSVTAYSVPYAGVGEASVTVDVRPGADVKAVSARLDALIAELIERGPTADEIGRVATRAVAGEISRLESVDGWTSKAAVLAEGQLYSDNPEHYRARLKAYASATPAQVTAALKRWLTRPPVSVTVVPGERDAYAEAAAVKDGARSPKTDPAPTTGTPKSAAPRTMTQIPAVADPRDVPFPAVQRAKLGNGILVRYVQRTTVPMTRVSMTFDAGTAADPANALGTQALMLSLLPEGTDTLSSIQIAEAQERLGATMSFGAGADRTGASLAVPTLNLGAAVELMGNLLRKPAFAPAEVARLKDQQLAAIAAETQSPGGLAARALAPILFGPESPYGRPETGLGTAEVVGKLGREQLVAFHQAWIRPDKAEMFVVSDKPLAEILPVLERGFGDWRASGTAGAKRFDAKPPAAKERVVLIDRPGSPQSLIYAGQVTPLDPKAEQLAPITANAILGTDFLSRLNSDLREVKAWSYGVYGYFDRSEHALPYVIQTSVQADRTADSIAALKANVAGFVGDKPLTEAEFTRAVQGDVRGLPMRFETGSDLLQSMQLNALIGRPDDYYAGMAGRYRALTRQGAQAAINAAVDPDRFVWVVVGDAKIVRPQLAKLGLPVEEVAAAQVADTADQGE